MTHDELEDQGYTFKILITEKLKDHEEIVPGAPWTVDNLFYRKHDQEIHVMVSHSATWKLADMRSITWEELESICPKVSQIDFEKDEEGLSLDAKGNWISDSE